MVLLSGSVLAPWIKSAMALRGMATKAQLRPSTLSARTPAVGSEAGTRTKLKTPTGVLNVRLLTIFVT